MKYKNFVFNVKQHLSLHCSIHCYKIICKLKHVSLKVYLLFMRWASVRNSRSTDKPTRSCLFRICNPRHAVNSVYTQLHIGSVTQLLSCFTGNSIRFVVRNLWLVVLLRNKRKFQEDDSHFLWWRLLSADWIGFPGITTFFLSKIIPVNVGRFLFYFTC